MKRVAAPLAVALLAAVLTACGGDDAEPGASAGATPATLVLDFQANAAHAGIYAALAGGLYDGQGVELDVKEPSASSDAPRLLEAGRVEFAILDIHDLGVARERGADLVGVAAIVQKPLAAVLARPGVKRPRQLEGMKVGVTGLPSDEAVLDSVVAADGGDPGAVERVTIGFNAVAALAGGRVDAATAFWNAEGVALERRGIEVTEFRVDEFGAPAYPELVLVTTRSILEGRRDLVEGVVAATIAGYEEVLADPIAALDGLLAAVPNLSRGEQRAQLEALLPAFSPPGLLDGATLEAWGEWDVEHGILDEPPDVARAFAAGVQPPSPR